MKNDVPRRIGIFQWDAQYDHVRNLLNPCSEILIYAVVYIFSPATVPTEEKVDEKTVKKLTKNGVIFLKKIQRIAVTQESCMYNIN